LFIDGSFDERATHELARSKASKNGAMFQGQRAHVRSLSFFIEIWFRARERTHRACGLSENLGARCPTIRP
jgi:hypothetical protein